MAPAHAPLMQAAGIGPSWPYPEPASRSAGGFDTVFGIAFVGGGVFALFMSVFVISVAGADVLTLLALALFVIGFPAIGISTMRSAAKQRRNAARLSQSGVRCWGRIVSSVATGASRGSNGMRWVRMKITVEPFAALDARGPSGYREHAAGARVADRVVIDWFVSMLQMAMLQPGYYCAFLLDPADPSVVHLDALATPQGDVAALT